MSPDLNELFLLSGLFTLLGLLSLRIIGWNKTMMKLIGAYVLMITTVVYFTEMKWLFAGAIAFMLIASYYTLWVLFSQFRTCMRDIKEIDAQEEEKKSEGCK
jgi:membrane protein YdbS with pleckstrin-like domain